MGSKLEVELEVELEVVRNSFILRNLFAGNNITCIIMDGVLLLLVLLSSLLLLLLFSCDCSCISPSTKPSILDQRKGGSEKSGTR